MLINVKASVLLRSPATWRFLLRGQSWIILDPVAAGPAEAALAGRNRRVVDLSKSHVEPRLASLM